MDLRHIGKAVRSDHQLPCAETTHENRSKTVGAWAAAPGGIRRPSYAAIGDWFAIRYPARFSATWCLIRWHNPHADNDVTAAEFARIRLDGRPSADLHHRRQPPFGCALARGCSARASERVSIAVKVFVVTAGTRGSATKGAPPRIVIASIRTLW